MEYSEKPEVYKTLHFQVRNKYFEEAMKRVIRADDVVMDIGAGTGLLSVIAARFEFLYYLKPRK